MASWHHWRLLREVDANNFDLRLEVAIGEPNHRPQLRDWAMERFSGDLSLSLCRNPFHWREGTLP